MPEEITNAAQDADEIIQIPDVLPVMALKDVVLFPYVIVPLSVGRNKSVKAVDQALAQNRLILLITQKDSKVEDPKPDELYEVGCVAVIMRMLKLPDGNIRILVQGISRAKVDYFTRTEPYLEARLNRIEEPEVAEGDLQVEAFSRSIKEGLEKANNLGKQISPEVMLIASNLDDPLRLADLAASNLSLKVGDAQSVLETVEPIERLKIVNELLSREISLLEMQQEISSQVRGEMDKSQREYFLRQQLKAIRKELGEDGDDINEEIEEYRKKAEEAGLSDEAKEELEKQLKRLSTMHPEAAEASVVRTWLDWITGLPWSHTTEDNLDITKAREILDEDHYDLEKIKDRIIEFLAVRQLRPDSKGPILCFVGPPGVGKTSLGRSIARALGRKFIRISLGGVRDEAEIRGHRRTYVGALPGRIIQGIHQAGTSNPVFMLDEVDKIGADFRGDPSSALLEVLDPEQNYTFRDHYLGVAYDLSHVMFITTANVTDTIQPAFLDRMEVIRLSGYTEEEKLEIARRYLIPKQLNENGLTNDLIEFTTPALHLLIDGYTREAGLRNLEREIGSVCRKVAVEVAKGKRRKRRITPTTVERLLGPRKFLPESQLKEDRVGVVTGLAYTVYGGDVLFVEALALPGKGKLTLTGSLGDVMKESAEAALSFARSRALQLGIDPEWFDTHSIHVHVPAGAIPKDGPSAGVTLLTAMVSAASNRPVRHDLAMTGEITLRGDVLPVGGIKEKVLAALRAGVRDILLPAENERDLVELPPRARRHARIQFVRHADEVLTIALVPAPGAAPGSE
ncbi:MAG: endopeptidase La [Acidobacteria bacterium]|nr:endopeptidase La [Acidobacteriota bacterium]